MVDELTAADQGKKSIKEAITAYEEDMRSRVMKEIPISVMQAKMVHSWETLMNAPMIKMGMNKQKEAEAEEKAHNGGSVETSA